MLPIFWRASARDSLASIIFHISDHNPPAARRMRELIETSILPAAEHPDLFRAGRVSGTSEIVAHPNYVLIYCVTAERIEVMDVLHSRQQYP